MRGIDERQFEKDPELVKMLQDQWVKAFKKHFEETAKTEHGRYSGCTTHAWRKRRLASADGPHHAHAHEFRV
jgi:hypothetical protein